MVHLDKVKVKEILQQLYNTLGIDPSEIELYTEDIVKRAQNRSFIKIPRRGNYVLVLEGGDTPIPLVYFRDGWMYAWGWESPLRGNVYVLGRYGYAKREEGGFEWRERMRKSPYERYISRVQLFIQPYEDHIEVLNVGLNEVRVLREEEFERYKKERKEKEERRKKDYG